MNLAGRLAIAGSLTTAAAAGLMPGGTGVSASGTLGTIKTIATIGTVKPSWSIVKPPGTIGTIKPPVTIGTIKPGTTKPGGSPTPGQPGGSPTPGQGSSAPDSTDPACVYRRDLIVATTDLSASAAELGLRQPTSDDVANLDEPALAALHAQHLFPYALEGSDDPLALSAELGKRKIVAAPVLLVLPATQWGFAAANPPSDLGQPAPEVNGALNKPKQVAVLDTGFNATAGDPAWMKARVRAASGFDADTTSPSVNGHGKFVASLIVQERPNSQITVGAVTPVALERFTGDGGKAVPSTITDGSDELQLWLGMQRLLGSGVSFDVLDLSVGSYTCPMSRAGLATQAALIDWYATTKGKPVATAAGNHGVVENPAAAPAPVAPFVPAAMPRVKNKELLPAFEQSLCAAPVVCKPGRLYDVQSIDSAGTLSLFANPGRISAPGERLIGVRLEDGTTSSWSGTSMSTALVTAALADGAQLAPGTVVPAKAVAAE